MTLLVPIVGLRVTRRWNQTGQKLAGEPDIAKTFFYSHHISLWVAIFATYVYLLQKLSRRSSSREPSKLESVIAFSITSTAFIFKVAYTYAEAPELLQGFPQAILKGYTMLSLLIQARIVFLKTFLALMYGLLLEWRFPTERKKNIAGSLSIEIVVVLILTMN